MFVRQLKCENSEANVRVLRQVIFVDAAKDLADPGDVLVKRKKTSVGISVTEKHIDYTWCLVGAIKR